MKYKRLAIFLENKKGIFHQVMLEQKDMDMVFNFIAQMKDGVVPVSKEIFSSLEFVEKK